MGQFHDRDLVAKGLVETKHHTIHPNIWYLGLTWRECLGRTAPECVIQYNEVFKVFPLCWNKYQRHSRVKNKMSIDDKRFQDKNDFLQLKIFVTATSHYFVESVLLLWTLIDSSISLVVRKDFCALFSLTHNDPKSHLWQGFAPGRKPLVCLMRAI